MVVLVLLVHAMELLQQTRVGCVYLYLGAGGPSLSLCIKLGAYVRSVFMCLYDCFMHSTVQDTAIYITDTFDYFDD